MLNAEIVGKAIRKAREGHRKPTLETFFRLSEALNMPASDLVRRIEQELAMDGERISNPQ